MADFESNAKETITYLQGIDDIVRFLLGEEFEFRVVAQGRQ